MTLSAEEMTDKVAMTHREHVSNTYIYSNKVTYMYIVSYFL